mgnify:FL=1
MREEVKLFPFYEKLTAAEREKLAGSARVHTFERGAQVHGGDCTGLILVLEGRLRAYILSEEGREITLFRVEKGGVCLLSASCVLRGLSVDVFIRADTAARVLLVPSEVFRELSESSLAVSAFTSEMMAERLSRALWVLDEVLNKKFDARLAALLVEEAGYAGGAEVRLTHEQLAAHLGTVREAVSRMLKYFEQEGLVFLSRGGVRIEDMAALRALAGK